jgi:small-conductance mechanosensitive channel
MRSIRYAVGMAVFVALVVLTVRSTAAAQEAQIRRYIIVHGTSMSGSWDTSDDPHVTSLQEKYGDDFAWFRQDGHEYVVTDAAVLGELHKAMEPQQKVNRMQADVNKEQSRVNAMQSQVNAHQADVNALQRQVNEQVRNGDAEASQTAVNQRQSQVNGEQSKVNAEQAKVNVMQEKVNEEQRRVSAELNRRVQQILGSALQRGVAKELN